MAKWSKGLTKTFIESYADKTPPWSEVGYITYKRTYARKIDDRTEEWHETIGRVCNGLVEIGGKFTQDELEALYDHLFYLRGCVSGRALWQLGTDTVRKIGADSLQNCWHVACDELSAFTFTFNQLMLGGGVGFNIRPEFVYSLPVVAHAPKVERVDTPDCDFIVPDNREGWVALLDKVLECHFVTGKDLRYYTKCVRSKGEPIHGFGGTASGPGDLVKGLGEIIKIIQRRHGKKLRPIDCLDMMNIIGQIVVAGNVRRSAEIAIGDPKDLLFLEAKNWNTKSIPDWRGMSNNSIGVGTYAEIPEEFWAGYEREGEPYGLVNIENCRRFGRLADGEDYRTDYGVVGVNPCAEITLESREACNLAEIFLPNIEDEIQFKEVAGLLYKACKTISCFPFSDPRSNEVVMRNHRIGLGVTGYQSSKWKDNANAFDQVYIYLEDLDREYSHELGVSPSVKLTTVKPSGTLSLLPANCTPGLHAGFSRYMIRRIRFAADDPLVELCRDAGYHVEPKRRFDGTDDTSTMVISFPMRFSDDTVVEEDMNVIEELEVQLFLQTWWADNSVSATHYFKDGEVPAIKEWLANNYDNGVKATSFLKSVGHGFDQAPLEKITEEEYLELKAKTTPITRVLDGEERGLVDTLECAGGHCPIK